MTILQVDNVRKNYGEFCALQGVSFAVEAGEMFGLLGPNGAGKTTLLSILAGLLEPTSGQVKLLGRAFTAGDKQLKSAIGIVPQELAIYNELTARENLRFFGELYSVRGIELAQRVEQILQAIGLEDRADHRAGTFSGGMKRRLNLGAALVHRPSLLLLDEPTTGVDPQSRNHIFEGVRRLNAEGLTVLYTSHYMEEVQALCPRIGIIDHGRLIACDTLAKLLAQLPGSIRFRVPRWSEALRLRLLELEQTELRQNDGQPVELISANVSKTLVELVNLLKEEQIALTMLETEEPNLERVFLHLTGHDLRD